MKTKCTKIDQKRTVPFFHIYNIYVVIRIKEKLAIKTSLKEWKTVFYCVLSSKILLFTQVIIISAVTQLDYRQCPQTENCNLIIADNQKELVNITITVHCMKQITLTITVNHMNQIT